MIKNKKYQTGPNHRSAFTLVEMLVSVTLVLLIMSLFAAIFGLASDTIKLQRGIGENNQRARALVTVIRNDFEKRTPRNVLPYYPTEDAATSPTPFGARGGYLYISTNDPASYHDDLIQFTVDARLLQQDQDDTTYFGAAKLLFDQIAESAGDTHGTGVLSSPQQPEADDRDIRLNSVAASSAAEVMLFLRNGKLIRRISLLRDPGPVESNGAQNQPVSGTGNDFFVDSSDTSVPAGTAGGGRFFYVSNLANVNQFDPTQTSGLGVRNSDDFLEHFDFSARPLPVGTNVPTNAQFLGVDALNNELGATAFPLANPANRWGFNPVTGFSREHGSSVSQVFMGRYVHGETSDPFFNWPLAISYDNVASAVIANGNPMDVVNFPVTLPTGADVVVEFNGGPTDGGRGGRRRVEDVLMMNVHEFRIEIFDERLQQFVVPGYGSIDDTQTFAPDTRPIGDFHIDRSLQVEGLPGTAATFTYGPLAVSGVQPSVFDTWHPQITTDFDGDTNVEMSETQPPYLPYRFYPPRQNDAPAGPSSSRAPAELSPTGNVGVPLVSYWKANTQYNKDDVVFAWDGTAASGWDANGDGSFQWDLDSAAIPNQAFQIAYQCTVPGTSDAAPPPKWPETPGLSIKELTNVKWVVIDNRRPLKSARITLRFKDEASDQIRQLTMVLPLTDD